MNPDRVIALINEAIAEHKAPLTAHVWFIFGNKDQK